MTTPPQEDRLDRIEAALAALVTQVENLGIRMDGLNINVYKLTVRVDSLASQILNKEERPVSDVFARLKAFTEETQRKTKAEHDEWKANRDEMLRHSEEMRRGTEENKARLDKLQKKYGKVSALDQVDIRLERIEKHLGLPPIDFDKWEPSEEQDRQEGESS